MKMEIGYYATVLIACYPTIQVESKCNLTQIQNAIKCNHGDGEWVDGIDKKIRYAPPSNYNHTFQAYNWTGGICSGASDWKGRNYSWKSEAHCPIPFTYHNMHTTYVKLSKEEIYLLSEIL